MGWSCRADAAHTMDAISRACVAQTGSSNTWRAETGTDPRYEPQSFTGRQAGTHFWEVSRREHEDGRITGTVFAMLPDGYCRKVGSITISPDGTVTRAPKSLLDMVSHFYGAGPACWQATRIDLLAQVAV